MSKKVCYCCSITQSGLLSPNVITSAAWDKVVTPLMFLTSLCTAPHRQTHRPRDVAAGGEGDEAEMQGQLGVREESLADQDQD